MKIVFRVDASLEIGSGHIKRCLTLADGLIKKGAECHFISRHNQWNFHERIKKLGFKIHPLPICETKYHKKPGELRHSSWLGCDWQVDARQTKNYIEKILPDWLIVDHYAIDYRWQTELRTFYKKLMVIDDLADRKHECDLLLDQNLLLNMNDRYSGIIPNHCVQLLGPKYALLEPNYSKLRLHSKPRNAPLKNLLIFFGGTDQHNLTGLTLSALEQINIPFNYVDVVISKDSPNYDKVKDQASLSSKVSLHSDLPSLAPLIKKGDLAIGAGGTTNWERFCLGLPSLVITLAENQKQTNQDLHEMGLIELLGDVEKIQIDNISSAIKKVLSSKNISNWSKRCMNFCSGGGTDLVVDKLLNISS